MKILGIVKADINIDTKNSLVFFWNILIKLYYYYKKETNISYSKIINDLIKKIQINLLIRKNFYTT